MIIEVFATTSEIMKWFSGFEYSVQLRFASELAKLNNALECLYITGGDLKLTQNLTVVRLPNTKERTISLLLI